MYHHTAQLLLCDAPIAVFDLHLSAHTLAMPAAGCFGLRPARCLHQKRQARLLLAPDCQLLPHGTGARHERDAIDLGLDTDPQGTATLGLTIRDDPTPALQPHGQTLLKGYRGFHTIPAVAIAQAHAQRYPAIPTHAETQQDVCEIVTTVFAMPIGRAGRSRRLRGVCIRPIERNGRRILMEPRCRERRDLQRFAGDHPKHLVEIGGKQRLEDAPQAVILERSPGEPWLQQWHHPALFQPFAHLVEGMRPVQNREDQGFDPAATREPMGRMGRDETINECGNLQAS